MVGIEVKLMKDERFKQFCLAQAPAVGVIDKSPTCLESGIMSGSMNLV